MHVGIIIFPGMTCERDTQKWLLRGKHVVSFISHNETSLIGKYNLIIIPGGFAYGDRVYERATGTYVKNPGAQAMKSPVVHALHREVGYTPILGICNGFQILVHAGLLPGKLERNITGEFYCDNVECAISVPSILGSVHSYVTGTIPIPVAHGYGRYRVSEEQFIELAQRRQIFLQYADNFNGSDFSIAGVSNSTHTVWGMMPHPERSPIADLLLAEVEHYVRNF